MQITKISPTESICDMRGDQFTKVWKEATVAQRVVLPDKRPAVRKLQLDGHIMYYTVHPILWDILKQLPRNRPMVENNRKICEACGNILKVSREYETCWAFTCDKCKSSEVHDKKVIGGTFGQGEKEKV